MGNAFRNSNISKDELNEDLIKINKITTNKLLLKKTNITLNFKLTKNGLRKLFTNKIIICQMVILK